MRPYALAFLYQEHDSIVVNVSSCENIAVLVVAKDVFSLQLLELRVLPQIGIFYEFVIYDSSARYRGQDPFPGARARFARSPAGLTFSIEVQIVLSSQKVPLSYVRAISGVGAHLPENVSGPRIMGPVRGKCELLMYFKFARTPHTCARWRSLSSWTLSSEPDMTESWKSYEIQYTPHLGCPDIVI